MADSADDVHFSNIVSEISEILEWDSAKILQEIAAESAHPGSHVRDAWNNDAPSQQGEIESFYSTTRAYILDLIVEGERDVRRMWREAVVNTLDQWWGGAAQATVLDYGGGVGTDTLFFARVCRSAYYYDLPGHTSEFAMKRFAHHGAGVTSVMDTGKYNAHFDALVSFEVLEHLIDPIAHLGEMIRLTKTGGLLFLTESFDLVSNDYPSHLPSNLVYAGRLDDLMQERGCQPVTILEGRIHVYVKGPSVTAAVPVYNAYDHTRSLLESIRTSVPGYPINWLFVNDASSDLRISELLSEFAATFDGTCRIIDRKDNWGFPLTANEAIEAAGTTDVILLNSDTVVYDGWARKLVQAAYSDPTIGTVTPLSNNASVYSMFKRITMTNTLNRTLGLANLPVIDIPVGVGFCIFIKRVVIERIGVFDPIFGLGYGEETDFCLRAAAVGYRNVLAPTVFIYHAGSASMLEAMVVRKGESTIQEHEDLIASKFPEFSQDVQRFMTSGVIERMEWDLANRYVTEESSCRPSVAVVVHDDVFSPVIGGTTDHLRDMVRELGSDFAFYFITPPALGATQDRITVTAYVDGVVQAITPYRAEYKQVFAELNPSLIHIHHLMHFSIEFIEALTAWSGSKYFTIHDYFGLCEQVTLLNYKQEFCNIPGSEECGRCANALWGTNYDAITTRRDIYQRLVDSCEMVIAPSNTALMLFRRAISIPDAKVRVIPHPTVMQKYRNAISDPFRQEVLVPQTVPSMAVQAKIRDAQLRVGFIGYNAPQKGTALLREITKACAQDPILFVSIGEIGTSASEHANILSTGRYNRLDVVDLIKANNIDVIIVGSIWPETFCYTVTEAWMAGVPVITGPIGAQAERVRATGAGLSLPDLKVETFTQTLRFLAHDHAQLHELKLAATSVPITSKYAIYQDAYIRSTGGRKSSTRLFTSVRREVTFETQVTTGIPLVDRIVRVRKRLFPVGSLREKLYFWMHNRITHSYAGYSQR